MFRHKLKHSAYNHQTEIDGGWVLHNQMTGSLIHVDLAHLESFQKVATHPRHRLSRSFRNSLVKGGYLIPEDYDELDFMRQVWDKEVNSTWDKSLTIVTTDKCNLGCVYCYEEKSQWKNMDAATQDQVKTFTERYVTATPTDRLGVTWFGGEATLNMSGIENLSAFFIDLCARNGIAYQTYMITNGTTLTDHVIDRLVKCKIGGIQITIDGVKEDHDAKRPYLADIPLEQLNPFQLEQRRKIQPNIGLVVLGSEPPRRKVRSSYEDIMANVRKLHQRGFTVALRVNVDHDNKDRVSQLIDEMTAEGLTKPHPRSKGIIDIYTSPITTGCGGCRDGEMNKEEHSAYALELGRKMGTLSAKRFRKVLKFAGTTCTANMNHQYVINQDGTITKCWHHATDPRYTIGHISDLELAGKGTASLEKPFSPLEDPECSSCKVLPICFGGCKVNNNHDKEGHRNEAGCNEARYVLDEQVKELYKLSVKT